MSTYRSPSINGMTLMMVTGWLVINLLLFFTYNSLGDADFPLSDHSKTQITRDANSTSSPLLTTQSQSWMEALFSVSLVSFRGSLLASAVHSSVFQYASWPLLAVFLC